jgi:hypothetical protein
MTQSLLTPDTQPLDPAWRMSVVECLRQYPLNDAIRTMEKRRAALARACPLGMLPLAEAAKRVGVSSAQLVGFLATRPALKEKCRTVAHRVYIPERILAVVRTGVKDFRLPGVPSIGRRRPA